MSTTTSDRLDVSALVTPPRVRPTLTTLVPPGATSPSGPNPPPSANVSFVSGSTGSADAASGKKVLRRLSALFHHAEGPEFAHQSHELPESPIASDDEFPIGEPEPIEDRVGLKVLVVTWNMGDALVSHA